MVERSYEPSAKAADAALTIKDKEGYFADRYVSLAQLKERATCRQHLDKSHKNANDVSYHYRGCRQNAFVKLYALSDLCGKPVFQRHIRVFQYVPIQRVQRDAGVNYHQ